VLDGVARHPDRVADAVAGDGRVHLDAGPAAEHLELVDRVRALQVRRDQHRLVALRLEPAGQLAGQRGLTGALQAGEQDDGRRLLGELQPAALAAEDVDELLVDDLDDLLAGLSAWDTSAPRRPFLEAAMNALTTGSATSASSSARRISRAVASMSASVSRPLPRSLVKIPERRSLKVSNTAQLPVGQREQMPQA
jgi:hypothetical protein